MRDMRKMTLRDISQMDEKSIKMNLVDLKIKKINIGLSDEEKLIETYMYATMIPANDTINQITKRYNDIDEEAVNIINRREYEKDKSNNHKRSFSDYEINEII